LEGRFAVRSVTLLTNKNHQTFDKQFASQDAIREALQVEVAKALEANGKRPALFDKLMWWKSSKATSVACGEPAAVVDMNQSSDRCFLANRVGFEAKTMCFKKGSKHLFVIKSIADNVTIEERNLGRGKVTTIKAAFDDSVTSYVVFNGDAPEHIEDAVVDLRSPIDSDFFTMERARVYVYLAVHDYEKRNCEQDARGQLAVPDQSHRLPREKGVQVGAAQARARLRHQVFLVREAGGPATHA